MRISRVIDCCSPVSDLSADIFGLSAVAGHGKFLVVRVAVADVCEIGRVLHVDDEGVVRVAVDGAGLQECDVFEGRRVLPSYIQLLLLIDLRLLELVLLRFLDAVSYVRTHHVLIKVNPNLAWIVGVVEVRRG